MERAKFMWGKTEVTFKLVSRADPAAFQIKFKKIPDDNNPNIFAESFFPGDNLGSTLFIYQSALDNASYLHNILAHELGHIMDLRHEFAIEREEKFPSVRFGRKNNLSIMNYFNHASEFHVSDEDRKDLAALYAYGETHYQELPIVDITPQLYRFREDSATPQDDSVPWSCLDAYATNGGIRGAVSSNGYPLSTSCENNDLSSDDNGDVRSPTLNFSETLSNATSTSNFKFEEESTNGKDHDEYPEALASASAHTSSISQIKCSRCGVRPEQNDVGLTENLALGPDFRDDPSARFSSQESAAFCIPEGITHSYNVCVTQEDAEREVRIGWKDYATRWKKGSVLRYTVCTETFESPQLAALVAREAAKAISMWQNIGTRFQKVGRDEKATFAIKYCFGPDNCRPDVFARAFFPKTSRGELLVYQLALEPSNVDFLAHILAHEFGHILGLSHEFAVRTSFLWGEKNDRSVMNYFSDLSQLQVGQQDRDELASYYECDEGQHKGLSITDIEPKLYQFPKSNKNNAKRPRSASKRLYLNYRIRRVRFRYSPSLIEQNRQQTTSSRAVLVSAFTPFYGAFALFATLVCSAFLFGQM
ncbi:hypothetical protein GGI43DRAFT_387124 [Trichoderma evansii]